MAMSVGLGLGTAGAATPITDVFLDVHDIRKWDESNGDTWDPFWADDDNLYAFNCDGRGFGSQGRNLAFNKLVGDHPHRLAGSMVNTMDAYGVGNAKRADGATWKALGQECIDGVFYAFVSRHTYGHESRDPLMRQTAVNASLIKSTDRGLDWTRSEEENYTKPMWPGSRFGGPFFIHYGKNGGNVARDGADRYVYATSPNGFWNGGDDYVLGRVERNKIGGLNAADWSYYTGGDGMDTGSWTDRLDRAMPILSLPTQCGTGPACYIPSLGTYLIVAWYVAKKLEKWFEPDEIKYDFYQAAHPWGPWKLVKSVSDRFIVGGHMYGPSLCAKFQEKDGMNMRMSMFTSGCPFEDVPGGVYKMWEIPLVLRTGPVSRETEVNDDDPRIVYAGKWTASTKRGFHDHGDDVHYTTTAGDSAEFTFEGTGIEYVAEKNADHGDVDVFLDGEIKRTVSLKLVNFPRLSQVVVFGARNLRSGRHTIRIVAKGGGYAILDAFKVIGGGRLPATSFRILSGKQRLKVAV